MLFAFAYADLERGGLPGQGGETNVTRSELGAALIVGAIALVVTLISIEMVSPVCFELAHWPAHPLVYRICEFVDDNNALIAVAVGAFAAGFILVSER